jgi:peptidoglycan DL-endopeptidase CwlO
MVRAAFRCALTLLLVLGPSAINQPALGQSSSSKEKEARKLQDQLDALDEESSILAEDANQAAGQLADAKAELRITELATKESSETFAAARLAAKQGVVRRYVDGPAANFSVKNSLQVESQRRAYRDVATGQNIDRIDLLTKATQDLEIARLRAAKTAKRVAAQQARIQRAIKRNDAVAIRQEQLLKRTKADVVKLLAAEETRRIKAEEKVAKALAAKQKAAAIKLLEQRNAQRKKQSDKAASAAAAAVVDAKSDKASKSGKSGRKPQIRQLPVPPPADPPTEAGAVDEPADTSDAAVVAAADLPTNAPAAQGASKAVAVAMAQIGKPYLWGADGETSFDCSGLMGFAWSAAGRSLPHSSRAQYAGTRRVSKSELQPGDLLFFGSPIHHVAMYIGDGQMVEAPHRRALVRVRSILRRDYVGAGRVG